MPITGTSGDDVINGSDGNDTIDGAGGNDTIDGGAGNDILYGGDGNDALTDTSGLNQLFGEAGDDTLTVNIYDAGGRVVLDGGTGNDLIKVGFPFGVGVFGWGVDVFGGDGDDTVLITQGNGNIVDLGTGNDRIVLTGASVEPTTLTLGEGADQVSIGLEYGAAHFNYGGPLVMTDYEPGVDSLTIAFTPEQLSGWDGFTNPFSVGFYRLVQDGADAVLQRDQDGPDGVAYWSELVRFQNVSVSALTAADLGGFNPDGSQPAGVTVNGTSGDDQLVPNPQYLTTGGLVGGVGDDSIYGFDGSDHLLGRAGNDVLYGGAGIDYLDGGVGNDILYGGDDNDRLVGGSGVEELYGEAGDDTLQYFSSGGVSAILDGGDGNNSIIALGDSYGAYGTDAVVSARGGAGDDIIFLGDLDSSGNQADLGAGNDTVTISGPCDVRVTLGQGYDVVNPVYFGSADRLAAVVTDYQAGVDHVSLDTILQTLPGWDSSINPFEAGYFRLFQSGGDAILQFDFDGGGDAFVDVIRFENVDGATFTAADFGGYQPVFVAEPARNLTGTSGADTLQGGGGGDTLSGLGGNDKLLGSAGGDILDGGAGDDRMIGGTGDDAYFVDSYNDVVIENAGEGNDSVFSTANYVLRDNIEALTLTGSANLYGYGNAGDNILTGNSGINKLFGLGGNDVLDGGAGSDRLFGGTGNDIYYVDAYADRAIENAGEGNDEVRSSASYRLGDNIETLTLTGSSGIWGYGNAGDNTLTGNSRQQQIVRAWRQRRARWRCRHRPHVGRHRRRCLLR